jgi:hypothetical protein
MANVSALQAGIAEPVQICRPAAFEGAAVEAVAAFEVADAAVAAGPVPAKAPLGFVRSRAVGGPRRTPAQPENPQRFAGRADLEAAIECDLARGEPKPFEFRHGVGQERVLCWVAQCIGRGGISPRAPRRVFTVTSASWVT